ncbi:glycoside hydrolase [Clostridium botulinum]|uniref:Autolytic lysozyme n=1 Tax=Clostridium botulinum (strain Eklund 17B / Type B) TaxID=935198 RepID=B2TMH9_CLOBB|nr:GH25 family lysozyme [Clostridium sp. M14]ACD24076.1 autolytic lysozyme [Clostridium botulinum B str. Eklund 17B (NRP)]MBY6975200.1 glycoside hydrolase [Clostridium botulinum]MBY7000181.1 glycoside hydrolase [Clostridium botulinum]MBZ9690727.1 glycoside hydrolase [Clostridium sp. M14]MCR1274956.1 glycoside hydrolase [Clostridium botulinum]
MNGIDVSNHNGSIDFNKVKEDNIEVVYIKATEGTTYKDPYLNQHYSGAKKAGLKTGFYHFLVGSSEPETQAENFYNNIKDKENDLKPCLDIETNNFNVMDYALRFIKKFECLCELELCIYTSPYFANENLDSRLAKYQCWIAHYGVETPMETNVWRDNYAGHQFTETGRINGINTNVDINTFTKDIFTNNKSQGYVVTQYLPNGYRGDNSFEGIDLEYVLSYFKDVRCYVRKDSKGVWIETQTLSMGKCLELKKVLGSWFYSIEIK